MLLGEQGTELAFHTVPPSALPTILKAHFLFWGILLSNGTASSRETETDPLWDACGPLLGRRKAGMTVLLQVKRNKDSRIRLLPQGECVDL